MNCISDYFLLSFLLWDFISTNYFRDNTSYEIGRSKCPAANNVSCWNFRWPLLNGYKTSPVYVKVWVVGIKHIWTSSRFTRKYLTRQKNTNNTYVQHKNIHPWVITNLLPPLKVCFSKISGLIDQPFVSMSQRINEVLDFLDWYLVINFDLSNWYFKTNGAYSYELYNKSFTYWINIFKNYVFIEPFIV